MIDSGCGRRQKCKQGPYGRHAQDVLRALRALAWWQKRGGGKETK